MKTEHRCNYLAIYYYLLYNYFLFHELLNLSSIWSDNSNDYNVSNIFNELMSFCLYQYLFENLGPQVI